MLAREAVGDLEGELGRASMEPSIAAHALPASNGEILGAVRPCRPRAVNLVAGGTSLAVGVVLDGLRRLTALARVVLRAHADPIADFDAGLGGCLLADSHGRADNLMADDDGIRSRTLQFENNHVLASIRSGGFNHM